MAKALFVFSGSLSPTIEAQTLHLPLTSGGSVYYIGTESQVQIPYRDEGTFSNLYVRITSSNTSNTSTILTRKNATTDGNLTVSVGAAATGVFEDTQHTDTVTAGDTWSYKFITTNTGVFTLSLISVLFESSTSTDTVTRIAASGSYNFTGTTPRYNALGGQITGGSATETNAQVRIKETFVARNLAVTIATNARSTATTVRTRKNTADGAMSLSYNGGTTGVVEEASPGTNYDSLTTDDLFCTQVYNGSGTSAHYITAVSLSLVSSSDANIGFCCNGLTTGITQNANTTSYLTTSGQLYTGITTETDAKVEVRADFTFSNLVIFIGTNTVSAASTLTLKKNGQPTSLSASITANTAGRYEDTTHTATTSAANDDTVNYELVTGSTGTSILIRNISVSTYLEEAGQQNPVSINEPSVSVSESLARVQTLIRPISDTPTVSVSAGTIEDVETYTRPISESSVSVSDSIEGTKIPVTEEGELSDVHFVEFPEVTTDSVTAVPPSGGVVSTTKTHKYDVSAALAPVTSSHTHKYNVIKQVLTSKTHLYNLISVALATKTHVYNVIKVVSAAKTHLYNVIKSASTTKTHLYNVIKSISVSKTHKYSLLNAITQTKTHLWNTIFLAIATRTHKYNVSIAVSPPASKTHKYNVIKQISQTKTHLYHLEGKITASRTHKYDVQAALIIKTIDEPSVSVSAGSVGITVLRAISISDTPVVSVSETLARTPIWVRSIADTPTISISEELTRRQTLKRSISDTPIVTVSDSAAITKVLRYIAISDPLISISEELTKLLSATRSISDTPIISVSETLERIQSLIRIIDDSTGETPISIGAGAIEVLRTGIGSIIDPRVKWYYSLVTRKIPEGEV